VGGHSARLWRTSGDGSSSTSGRLPPRPSGALTLIRAAGNLNVIPCKDTDASRKQLLAIPRRCYTNYGMGSLYLEGSGIQTTPQTLPRHGQRGSSRHKSTPMCIIMSACRTPIRPYFRHNTSLHCGRSPSYINKATGSLQWRHRDMKPTSSRTQHKTSSAPANT
jgi:hypothetical protein